MKKLSLLILLGFLLSIPLLGITPTTTGATTPLEEGAQRQLNYGDSVTLGLIQGITEFLPISSTGHLVITNRALGLDNDDLILLENGKETTYKEAIDNYAIIIQGGTILAILALYWKRVISIFLGFMGSDPRGLRLGRNLLIAFTPAVIIGLLIGKWISAHLFEPWVVVVALIGGAILMLSVEKWRSMKKQGAILTYAEREIESLSMRESFLIGMLQCVAMWPGTSRSMMTIVGGYFVGLSPAKAAEFSFLLGLITLSAASSYKMMTHGREMLSVLDSGPVLIGFIVAFISGLFAVKWLINYLTRNGLKIFAWYRIALAVVVSVVIYAF